MRGHIATLSSVILPDGCGLLRTPPRAKGDMYIEYENQFDNTTVFYDVFMYKKWVFLSGPPLRNLLDTFTNATFFLDGKRCRAILKDIDRTQRSYIISGQNCHRLEIVSDRFQFDIEIHFNNSDIFCGKNVLMTLSRDNDLQWIRDWIDYHVKVHKVNGILIYDNSSTKYDCDELLENIMLNRCIESAVVVPWPYKYGPVGKTNVRKYIWDSDYSQYSVNEHARRRFLASCRGVLRVDIDELVGFENEYDVFSYLAGTPNGVVFFHGRWMEPIPRTEGSPRHKDFCKINKKNGLSPVKWAMTPSRVPESIQMLVHGISPAIIECPEEPGFCYRHFRGINTNWKDPLRSIAHNEADVDCFEDTEWKNIVCRLGW